MGWWDAYSFARGQDIEIAGLQGNFLGSGSDGGFPEVSYFVVIDFVQIHGMPGAFGSVSDHFRAVALQVHRDTQASLNLGIDWTFFVVKSQLFLLGQLGQSAIRGRRLAADESQLFQLHYRSHLIGESAMHYFEIQ